MERSESAHTEVSVCVVCGDSELQKSFRDPCSSLHLRLGTCFSCVRVILGRGTVIHREEYLQKFESTVI